MVTENDLSFEDRDKLESYRSKQKIAIAKKSIRKQESMEALRESNPQRAKYLEKVQRIQTRIAAKNLRSQALRYAQRRSGAKAVGGFTKRFATSGKETQRRASIVKRLASAIGPSKGHAGPGRPRGSYRYGVPIQQVYKLQQQRKALAQLKVQKYEEELIKKGYSPEQIQQMKLQKQFQEANNPNFSEEEYQKYLSESTVSPNTQAMLDHLHMVQNKAKTDDMNMQRILREKKILNSAASLLAAPSLFKARPGEMEGWLERPETNPLRAPNIFKEDRSRNPNIMDTQGRPTIIQSVQPLNFFGNPDGRPVDTKQPIKLRFFK